MALGGRLGGALTGDAVARIVKKLIARAGLDREDFAAHSLRSGFLSSAAEHKADVFAMQRQSRHKNLDVLSGYVQSRSFLSATRARDSCERARTVPPRERGSCAGHAEAAIAQEPDLRVAEIRNRPER